MRCQAAARATKEESVFSTANEDDNTQGVTPTDDESGVSATHIAPSINTETASIASGIAAATSNVTSTANNVTSITNDLSGLPPGAYRITFERPSGSGDADSADSQNIDHAESQNINADDEDEVVYQGFLPAPTQDELYRRQAEELLRSAITLDDSAVRPIVEKDTELDDQESARNVPAAENDAVPDVAKDGCSTPSQRPISVVLLALLFLSAIALGIAFRGSQGDDSQPSQLSRPSCIANLQDRYDHSKLIIYDITSQDTLEDATSPQNKALEWIVCEDNVSSKLIDNRDPATGLLPTQAHGTKIGGDAGETQVLRRYAIAAFFFATQPWIERWNFLNPDVHECAWHESKKRSNWPYGDFDPAGFVCLSHEPTASRVPGAEANEIMLDDMEMEIHGMDLNFRSEYNRNKSCVSSGDLTLILLLNYPVYYMGAIL